MNVAVGNFNDTVIFGMEKFTHASAQAAKEKKKAFKIYKKGKMNYEEYKKISRDCKKVVHQNANNNIKRKAEKAAECTLADRQF